MHVISSLRRAASVSVRRAGVGMLLVAGLASPYAAPAIHLHAAAGSPSASKDPYVAGNQGFDVSFPNCTARLHRGLRFAVVGINGGRPFTSNRCVVDEWRRSVDATGARPSLYFNTAYTPSLVAEVREPCAAAAVAAGVFGDLRGERLERARAAWEIGCSEFGYAVASPPGPPAMWWADVETANPWSTDASLNRMTLDGISYAMRAAAGRRAGGIYSTPNMWREITGSERWSPTPQVAAMWVAGGSCATVLAQTPTWLSQGGLVFGVDADRSC